MVFQLRYNQHCTRHFKTDVALEHYIYMILLNGAQNMCCSVTIRYSYLSGLFNLNNLPRVRRADFRIETTKSVQPTPAPTSHTGTNGNWQLFRKNALRVHLTLQHAFALFKTSESTYFYIQYKHVFFIFAFGARDVFRREHMGISSQNGRWGKYFHRRKKMCTDNSGTNVLSTGLMVMKYRQEFRKYRMPLPVVFFFFVFLISNKS